MAMDINGIAFWHLCEENETVTSELYRSFLETYIPVWMDGNRFKGPVILHDNATPHKSRIVTEFMLGNNFDTWSHPSFSPDIHPCDFGCFALLK